MLKRTAVAIIAAASLTMSGCVVLRPGASANPTASGKQRAYTKVVALPASLQQKGVLVFGSQLASPPLDFYAEKSQKVKGINKDVADAVGKKLGVTVKWKQLPFAGLIPAVQSGKIDAGIDLIGDTAKRRVAVDFANYMNQATSPLVRQGNPEHITSVGNLCGKKVSIVRGGVQLELAQKASRRCKTKRKRPLTVSQFNDPGAARLAVQSGRVSAFLGNTPVMRYISNNSATKNTFDVGGKTTYQRAPIGIITAKSDSDVHKSIQSALDVLLADGTIKKILREWHVEDLALDSKVKAGK